MPASAKGGRYHHGDLRAALVDAAIDLIAERGVRGFSLAEASRRIGVSAAAPYRHFADRDDLLAAVAVRSLQVFAAMVAAEADDAADPRQQLAAMTRAYVRFAAQQRPLFDALYSWGLDKSRYPELQRAWEPVDAFLAVVTEICDIPPTKKARHLFHRLHGGACRSAFRIRHWCHLRGTAFCEECIQALD